MKEGNNLSHINRVARKRHKVQRSSRTRAFVKSFKELGQTVTF